MCAWSSGNHAQAVALAAKVVGTKAIVLMPEDAPAAKRAATEGYGAVVRSYDRYREDREALARRPRRRVRHGGGAAVRRLADHGRSGNDCPRTAARSITDLDVLVVPMSGGGLMAGCAVAARALNPRIELIGVEPTAGNDTQLSLAQGSRVRIEVPRTIADGLQVDIPGELTFSVNRRLVDEVLLVDDDEIVAAMRLLFERAKARRRALGRDRPRGGAA